MFQQRPLRSAVKSLFYCCAFNNFFNIRFHGPKSDRFNRCEEYKIKKCKRKYLLLKKKSNFMTFICIKKSKWELKKKIDKAKNKVLVVFDLGNTITFPNADVESFLHKKKLIMYNFTASTSSKQIYCSIWTEMTSERSGNDIVSSFISIWKKFW